MLTFLVIVNIGYFLYTMVYNSWSGNRSAHGGGGLYGEGSRPALISSFSFIVGYVIHIAVTVVSLLQGISINIFTSSPEMHRIKCQ